MEHECISQDQYKVLAVKVDNVYCDIQEIKESIQNISHAIYGNGKEGLLTRVKVNEGELGHLKSEFQSGLSHLKEIHIKDGTYIEKSTFSWKDVAIVTIPIVTWILQYVFSNLV